MPIRPPRVESSFGQITSTRNGGSAPGLGFGEPRNAQLALKVIF